MHFKSLLSVSMIGPQEDGDRPPLPTSNVAVQLGRPAVDMDMAACKIYTLSWNVDTQVGRQKSNGLWKTTASID